MLILPGGVIWCCHWRSGVHFRFLQVISVNSCVIFILEAKIYTFQNIRHETSSSSPYKRLHLPYTQISDTSVHSLMWMKYCSNFYKGYCNVIHETQTWWCLSNFVLKLMLIQSLSLTIFTEHIWESLHSLGHLVTDEVLRPVIQETRCSLTKDLSSCLMHLELSIVSSCD